MTLVSWHVRILTFLLAMSLLGASAYVQRFNNETFLQLHQEVRKEYAAILPVPLLRVMSFGYEGFMADIQWLQLIQHIGKTVISRGYEDDIAPYVEVITSLDPQFVEAYTVGVLLLQQDDPTTALRIGEKGLEALCDPEELEMIRTAELGMLPTYEFTDTCHGNAYLPSLLGVLSYDVHHDPQEAARYYALMSYTAGGEQMGKRFLALMLSNAQERSLALELWRHLAETASSDFLQEYAIQRTLREHHFMQLEEAYQRYVREYAVAPENPLVLVDAGYIEADVLRDPMNTEEVTYEYVFDGQGLVRAQVAR